MAIRITEYWGTVSGNESQLREMAEAQLQIYDALRYGHSAGTIASNLGSFGGSILDLLFGVNDPVGIGSVIGSAIDSLNASGRDTEATITYWGSRLLTELANYLASNSNYVRLEATVFFRQYTDTLTGETTRVVYGNVGDNSGAYAIQRVQLTSGQWLET